MENIKTKAAPSTKTEAAKNETQQGKHSDNSAYSQCKRLLAALRKRPLTTVEARRDLDIMMPATRVFELKAQGNKINTVWTSVVTVDNRKHRIARYVLVREADHEY